MSIIFITLGILFFVTFAHTVYTQSKQIEQLKKVVLRQRDRIESLSTPLPQDAVDMHANMDESWAEIEKIFQHDITRN